MGQIGGSAGDFACPGLDAQSSPLGHVQPVSGKDLAGAGDAQPALELILYAFGHAGDGVARGRDAGLDAVHQAGSNVLAYVQELAGQAPDVGHAALKLGLDRVPARLKRRAYAAFREQRRDQLPPLLQKARHQAFQPVETGAELGLDDFPVVRHILDGRPGGEDARPQGFAPGKQPGAQTLQPGPAGGKRGLDLVPVPVNQVGGHADTRYQKPHGIEQQGASQYEYGLAGHGQPLQQRTGQSLPQLQRAAAQKERPPAGKGKPLDQRIAGKAPRPKQQRTQPPDSAPGFAHRPGKKTGRAGRQAEQAEHGLHGPDAAGQYGTEGQKADSCRYQRSAKQRKAQAQGQKPAPEQEQTGHDFGHQRHGLLILFHPVRPALKHGHQGVRKAQRRGQKRLAQRFRGKVKLHPQALGLFHGRFHALVKVFSEDVLLAGFQGFGLDLLVVLHLHDKRPQEVHGLHVPEQVGKRVGLADALQGLLALGLVLNRHGFLELDRRLRALAFHVLHDKAHGALKGADAILGQLLQRSLQVYPRVGKVLDRVRSENLLQEVAHVGSGFVIGARAAPGYLQARGHFRHGFLPHDPHTGKGRGQLGDELCHVLQFHQAGLARRCQDVEGFVQLLVGDMQVVTQGKRGRTQVIHACPGRRGSPGKYSPVTFQLFPALDAAGHQNLHPLQNVRLVLVGFPRDVPHGFGQLCFVFRAHVAGNGDVADGVLLLRRRFDGHGRRRGNRRSGYGQLAHAGIETAALLGNGVAMVHSPGQRFLVAFELHLPKRQGAHGRFRPRPVPGFDVRALQVVVERLLLFRQQVRGRCRAFQGIVRRRGGMGKGLVELPGHA